MLPTRLILNELNQTSNKKGKMLAISYMSGFKDSIDIPIDVLYDVGAHCGGHITCSFNSRDLDVPCSLVELADFKKWFSRSGDCAEVLTEPKPVGLQHKNRFISNRTTTSITLKRIESYTCYSHWFERILCHSKRTEKIWQCSENVNPQPGPQLKNELFCCTNPAKFWWIRFFTVLCGAQNQQNLTGFVLQNNSCPGSSPGSSPTPVTF